MRFQLPVFFVYNALLCRLCVSTVCMAVSATLSADVLDPDTRLPKGEVIDIFYQMQPLMSEQQTHILEQGSLEALNAIAQDLFLPPSTPAEKSHENQETATINSFYKSHTALVDDTTTSLFESLGFFKNITPSVKKYDLYLLPGGSLDQVRDRLNELAELINNKQVICSEQSKIFIILHETAAPLPGSTSLPVHSSSCAREPSLSDFNRVDASHIAPLKYVVAESLLPQSIKDNIRFISSSASSAPSIKGESALCEQHPPLASSRDVISTPDVKYLVDILLREGFFQNVSSVSPKKALLLSAQPYVDYHEIALKVDLAKCRRVDLLLQIDAVGRVSHSRESFKEQFGLYLSVLSKSLRSELDFLHNQ